jgi:hypothetical protein
MIGIGKFLAQDIRQYRNFLQVIQESLALNAGDIDVSI